MQYMIGMLSVFFIASAAMAQITEESMEYRDGDTTLEGYLAYDNSQQEKRPGILIVHQWMGLTDYEKHRAQQLAELGYVAFALDLYGKNVRPENAQEASKQAGKFRDDRQLMRQRAIAGLQQLREQEFVDPDRIAMMGYCFGGGVALELGRSGADVKGIVSFHGNLDTPHPEDANNIKGKVLVLHGAADPHVDQEQVMAFWNEMEEAHVDWQLNAYGGAVHAFTQKSAGNDPSRGVAYNPQADQRSWAAMKRFYEEIFQ